MERLIKIPSEIIEKKPGIDQFAVQQIFKEIGNSGYLPFGVGKEYLVNGNWEKKIQGRKPESKRYSLSRWELDIARKTYQGWQLLTDKNYFDPVYKEKIIQRIIGPYMARAWENIFNTIFMCPYNSSLTLFVPWGTRLEGQFGEPELNVLDRLQSLGEQLRKKGVFSNTFLMPADLYATEINNINPETVNLYFEKVASEAAKRKFYVQPWSSIRKEQFNKYQLLSEKYNRDNIMATLPESVIYSAFKAAKKRSNFNTPEEVENAAFAYLRERLCEAEIIEGIYKPIKISAVAKNKDNDVDRELPRVYLIPEEYQFPWLK